MSIQDVLKKSFLNQLNSDLSTTSIVGTLILTALIGTYPVSYTHLDVYKRQALYTLQTAYSVNTRIMQK